MRAKEFIVENNLNDGEALEISRAMPATYAISKLPNSDFYKQYRFGVAIASARSEEARSKECRRKHSFSFVHRRASSWMIARHSSRISTKMAI